MSEEITEKRINFQRIAQTRVQAITEGFRKLGNLSNSSNYEYTEEDVKCVFEYLQNILNETKNMFESETRGFHFPGQKTYVGVSEDNL